MTAHIEASIDYPEHDDETMTYNMIEENTTWYLGTVESGASYRLAKYSSANGNELTTSTTTADVGLLRLGELMAGMFEKYTSANAYYLLTPFNINIINYIWLSGWAEGALPTDIYHVNSVLNLKSNVVITGGAGTKNNPFTLSLS